MITICQIFSSNQYSGLEIATVLNAETWRIGFWLVFIIINYSPLSPFTLLKYEFGAILTKNLKEINFKEIIPLIIFFFNYICDLSQEKEVSVQHSVQNTDCDCESEIKPSGEKKKSKCDFRVLPCISQHNLKFREQRFEVFILCIEHSVRFPDEWLDRLILIPP